MRLLAEVRDTIDTWESLKAKSSSLLGLIQLAQEENDGSLESSVRDELSSLQTELGKLEFDLVFSGEYDNRSAILTVHAGAGGTESQDWAQMLLRMYLRWAERKGYKSRILDSSPGDEAGIKSAMVEIEGRLAYGYAKTEHGVHRLVRISPFDSSKSRHTSFALIEVLPEADEDITITINSDDLRIDTFGAGGHGGQNVQKNSTAVRITHLPTNIVVTCQNERSLTQNKETAMKVLRARLMDLEINKQAEEKARLKGERISAEWGNQIRSYVLHPYKLVKDHRTGHESKDPNAVLDGELDELIEAFLLSTVGDNK
ncbi:MAG: peptide chain release factor 2 [Chloroflexi bacterium]|jgi:peptide chain release factor 2|nr:MAG: peptide chain release factor 2 [Chloroflexota bacterium]